MALWIYAAKARSRRCDMRVAAKGKLRARCPCVIAAESTRVVSTAVDRSAQRAQTKSNYFGAGQRRRQAEWNREHRELIARSSMGIVFIAHSAITRGVFAAVLWLDPPPIPHAVCASLDFARAPAALARKVRKGVQRDRAVVRSGIEPVLFALLRLLPDFVLDPLGKYLARSTVRMLRKPAE